MGAVVYAPVCTCQGCRLCCVRIRCRAKACLVDHLLVVLIRCENRTSCSPKVEATDGDVALRGVEPARRDILSAVIGLAFRELFPLGAVQVLIPSTAFPHCPPLLTPLPSPSPPPQLPLFYTVFPIGAPTKPYGSSPKPAVISGPKKS